ncbi:hypothetical protein, partial [Rhizobium sp. ZW T2_16]|uniref:hypothetical protein n=1 Tax=Rhizobium sp. ZW T2_16 TaxID=3378083 RepID=UPI003853D03F
EHYGQRPRSVPHPKAGHMAAPTSNVQKVDKTLAKPEPSTHGAEPKIAVGPQGTSSKSALGGDRPPSVISQVET